MNGQLTDRRRLFRPGRPRSHPYRMLLWLGLILACIWLLLQNSRGEIQPFFAPTPTPTRTAHSFLLEAEAYFAAGKLDDPNTTNDAIDTYKLALQVDPNNAQVWAELARIQTYSSTMLSTDAEREIRLQEALDSIEKAVALAPDDSTVQAIYAFVLDWNASSNKVTPKQRTDFLLRAETAAVTAITLDPNNVLAQAFYAEVLSDQQKWTQAVRVAEQTAAKAPDSMDVHRVFATVLEAVGEYRDAITEYKLAAELAPNLTFLYIRIGIGYRNLGNHAPTTAAALPLYNTALEYFDTAARINEQLGIRDPFPYIAIAKTYAQEGQFAAAARNAEKALRFDAENPDTYGQLGMIYVQAKNYESALPSLRCAVEGCTAEENLIAQQLVEQGYISVSVSVEPLELTNLDVAYYYIRYGSVLAQLHKAGDQNCERSLELMVKLRAAFPDDPILLQNIEDNEVACRALLEKEAP